MLKNQLHISWLRRSRDWFASEPLNNSIWNDLKPPLSLAFAKEHCPPVETVPGEGVKNGFFDLDGEQSPHPPASHFVGANHQALETFDQQLNLPAHPIQLEDRFRRQFTGRDARSGQTANHTSAAPDPGRCCHCAWRFPGAASRFVGGLLAQPVSVQVGLASLTHQGTASGFRLS